MLDDSARRPIVNDADSDPAPEPATEAVVIPPPVSAANREVSRPILLAAIVPLLGIVAWQVPNLWKEWKSLQAQQAATRASALVGYIGVSPAPQFAEPPKDWIHDDQDRTLLWSGWEGNAHSWFTTRKNELDQARLVGPMGRDVQRAIDRPIVEINGGLRWERIPEEAPVVGVVLGDSLTVYPLTVLHKVMIVNDQVGEKCAAVIYTPFVDPQHAVSAYDPVIDATRLTFGTSGYFYDRYPLLYDRSTGSLWRCDGDEMTAVTGHYKGTSLARLARLPIQNWSSCRDEHPQTRLVVGADRSIKPKRL